MVYLISEKTLKQRSLITDATLGYLIKPAIELSQKIGLRGVIGDCLLDKLKMLVSTKNEQGTGYLIDEPEYIHYKDLLTEQITDFLVYRTMSEIVIPMRDKMRNAGIVNTVDNNYQQPTFKDEIMYVKNYWDDKASYFAAILRDFIESNLNWFPEYKCNCDCGKNDGKVSNVYHCGIVL